MDVCEYSENYRKLIKSQLKEVRKGALDFNLYDCPVLSMGNDFSFKSELPNELKVDESLLEMRKITCNKRKRALVEGKSEQSMRQ